MSFGDHLDELRKRIIYSLFGLLAATILCFNIGHHIIEILTTPYCVAMEQLGFDPRMIQLNPIESFIEYFKISLKFGLVLAAPWVLYQLWRFIATGLYSSERKIIRLFAPASILLFVIGSSFMVTIVLSGLMKFLIGISMWFPLPQHDNFLYRWLQPPVEIAATSQAAPPPVSIPIVVEDPVTPIDGQMWFNTTNKRFNIFDGERLNYLQLRETDGKQFVEPLFSVSQYLGFVVNLALAFGFGFQIPIVVVFLITLRIVPSKMMAKSRKFVILGIALLAAILTPSPDAGTMMLLALPMIFLFESGMLIGRIIERRAENEADSPLEPD